jgi:archaellum component FlaC
MTATNNAELDLALLQVTNAVKEIGRMNYTLAIKHTLIRMLDELERLEKEGSDVTELVSLVRSVFDYTTYITDTPNEVPNA